MWRTTRALLALLALGLAVPAGAAAAPGFVRVGTFDQPVHAAAPPRDTTRLFVVEQPGVVRVVKAGVTLPEPFLDISADVLAGGERGLLSIAFPFDYEASGRFYVYLTAAPAGELQVREYRRSAANPDRADPAGRVVWRQAHDQATNHNGGQIDFGPDGLLWLATGDGGGANDQFGHARDLSSQLGKVLRIDPAPSAGLGYTVPPGNPYAGSPVWASGLRNPFRFSFDHRGTRDLVIGDVGQGAREEIDWAPFAEGLGRGADYGWGCREGTLTTVNDCDPGPNYLPPVWEYARDPNRAVTGGFVVRDRGLPTLVGRYVFADFFGGLVHSLLLGRPPREERLAGLPPRGSLASFAEDACGRLYVVSLQGSVDRVQDGALGPCVLKPDPVALVAAPPPPPPAAPARVDRTSPRVRIAVARRGRVGRRTTPRITLTATEACRVTVTARVAGARLKRVRGSLRAGRRTVVRLRATRRGERRIRLALRRHRRATLVVAVRAADAAGNVGRVQRRLRLRR